MTDALPLTVAVVDDDASIRRLVKHFLHASNYAVIEATSGAEARQVLSEYPWDVVILDRRFPDVDGVDLCREIKANPDFMSRYVIMLTGENEESHKIEGLDLGADDYVTKPFRPPELLARIRAAKRIVDLQKDLMVKNKRLEQLSITDGLTQLYNHRYFQDEFARAFEQATRYERPLSVVIFDIDFFKKVNDTFGHAAGDQVLREVSRLFTESIRATDLAARYGGEEFAVLMPETTLEDAILFGEKVRKLVESTAVMTETGEVNPTISVGVANTPYTKVRSTRQLIECADKALYRAKRAGRNQVQAERRTDASRKTRKSA